MCCIYLVFFPLQLVVLYFLCQVELQPFRVLGDSCNCLLCDSLNICSKASDLLFNLWLLVPRDASLSQWNINCRWVWLQPQISILLGLQRETTSLFLVVMACGGYTSISYPFLYNNFMQRDSFWWCILLKFNNYLEFEIPYVCSGFWSKWCCWICSQLVKG